MRDVKACKSKMRMCSSACLGMGNRKEKKRKEGLKDIQNVSCGDGKYAMQEK